MLCLKAEALEEDHHIHPQSLDSNCSDESGDCNGGNSGGFVLPIKWASSINRYLQWKSGKVWSRSFLAPDDSSSELEEDAKPQEMSGQEKSKQMCHYKHQLEEEITTPCNEEEAEENVDDICLSEAAIDNIYIVENLWHHPNQLSEEMVLRMRDIFLFLADSSKLYSSDHLVSPASPHFPLANFLASFSDSPIVTSLVKSPSVGGASDPYGVSGQVDWKCNIGTYSTAVEVSCLSVGKKELEYATMALKRFRMLVEQLAEVDPSQMSCNEKLAFWINLYHALIMHACLAYGVPRNVNKLFSLMQKASYTVGGQSVSAVDIECTVLKMNPATYHPQIAAAVALQKFNSSNEQKKYTIDHAEPLLYFALSCGLHSSPAVRIFSPQNVNELLKRSMKDYIQATVGISNKGKLLVPKLLHCFAKGVIEDSLLPEWICRFLTPQQASMVRECLSRNKWKLLGARSFCVLPFDSRFRFLFLLEDDGNSLSSTS